MALLLLLNVFAGAVSLPFGQVLGALTGCESVDNVTRFIVCESRLPAALTALIAGAALGMSGLLLQFLFRNPLAGPSVLGVSGGAGLGVALVMLCMQTSMMQAITGWGSLAVVVAAMAGATAITMLVMAVSVRMSNDVMVLVVGMMTGQIASALVAMMSSLATAEGLRGFVMWGMGSFTSVGWNMLLWLILPVILSVLGSVLIANSLNVAMLGDGYAKNLGIDTHRLRHIALLLSSVPVAVVTAFCGPIALLGLAVPHLTRLLFPTDDFRCLLPVTLLCGAAVAMLCNLLSTVFFAGGISMPINVITPIVCSPVIIYIILKQ